MIESKYFAYLQGQEKQKKKNYSHDGNAFLQCDQRWISLKDKQNKTCPFGSILYILWTHWRTFSYLYMEKCCILQVTIQITKTMRDSHRPHGHISPKPSLQIAAKSTTISHLYLLIGSSASHRSWSKCLPQAQPYSIRAKSPGRNPGTLPSSICAWTRPEDL